MTQENSPGTAPESPATGNAAAGNTDIAELSYEEARAELVNTVRTLEAGNLTLEQSLALWKRGEALADRCQEWLDGARTTIAQAKAETAEEE